MYVLHSVPKTEGNRNPFIRLLVREQRALMRAEYFSWRHALFERYDVFHLHWPEYLVASRHFYLMPLKVLLNVLLLIKLRSSRIVVVHTVHNQAPHFALRPTEKFLLNFYRRVTAGQIIMTGPRRDCGNSTVYIPHGDYRDGFVLPLGLTRPNLRSRVLIPGQLRSYKNVPATLAVLASVETVTRVTVAGEPIDRSLVPDIEAASKRLGSRGRCILRFVSDTELEQLLDNSDLVLLNYTRVENSGIALLALSRGVPVMMPNVEAGQTLRRETGSHWMHLFDGPLTPEGVRRALSETTSLLGGGFPELPLRNWESIAQQHHAFYASLRAELYEVRQAT